MSYSKQTWQDSPNTTTPITAARLSHIEDGIEANSNAIEALGGGVAMFTAQYAKEWVESEVDGEIVSFPEWVFRLTNGATAGKVRQAFESGQLPVLQYVKEENPYGEQPIKCAYFTHCESTMISDIAHFKTDTAEITITTGGLVGIDEDPTSVTFTGTL